MKINHRIGLNVNSEIKDEFEKLGIYLEKGITTFNISESDRNWKVVTDYAKSLKAIIFINTKFTPKELRNADHLVMAPSWQHLYPEPEGSYGYFENHLLRL